MRNSASAGESGVDLAFAAGSHEAKVESHRPCRRLQSRNLERGIRVLGIAQNSNGRDPGQELVQDLQPLGIEQQP